MDNYESLRRTKLRCKQAGSARYEAPQQRGLHGLQGIPQNGSKEPSGATRTSRFERLQT